MTDRGESELCEHFGLRALPTRLFRNMGYAVQFDLWWDVSIDFLSASTHGFVPQTWTEEDKKIFFSSGFMRREWFLAPPKGLMSLNSPDEFYLRPPARKRGNSRDSRSINLSPEVRALIEAQEREGKLVFEEGEGRRLSASARIPRALQLPVPSARLTPSCVYPARHGPSNLRPEWRRQPCRAARQTVRYG